MSVIAPEDKAEWQANLLEVHLPMTGVHIHHVHCINMHSSMQAPTYAVLLHMSCCTTHGQSDK